jgi:hypothetical protein
VKWFQVDSDTPDDPKIKATIRRGLSGGLLEPNGGQAAAGALLLLWCYIANHGGGDPGIGADGDGNPLPIQEMADECLFESVEQLQRFLAFLSEKRHIDPDAWARGLVVLPAMTKRADAYARSKGRGRAAAGEKPAARAKPGEKSPGLALTDKTVQTPPTPPREGGQLSLTPPPAAGPTVEQLVACWQANRKKGPAVTKITDARRKAYAAALRAEPDLNDWARVIRWADTQAWANAPGVGSHANWRLDLDYLTKPGKMRAALERMQAPVGSTNAAGRVAPTAGKYAAVMQGGDE